MIASNFVRLPITLPRYQESVHAKLDACGGHAATCVDCHGSHDLQHAQVADSGITVGVVESYLDSYHEWAVDRSGPLVATCIDCHSTHAIHSPLDPVSAVHPDLVTGWLPAWVVRVSKVVHYYEAIPAVSAIIIRHLIYVIFMPSEYPMSTIWLDGRMPAHEWKTMHPAEFAREGESAIQRAEKTKTPPST